MQRRVWVMLRCPGIQDLLRDDCWPALLTASAKGTAVPHLHKSMRKVDSQAQLERLKAPQLLCHA